jgi:hypothetical protein
MRNVLYAVGIEPPSNPDAEEQVSTSEDFDEKFLDRVVSDMDYAGSFYAERDAEFDRQEKWYFRDHYESGDETRGYDVPVNETEAVPSNIDDEHLVTINIPFNSVQRAHTMMTGEDPIVESLIDTKNAEKVVQFLHGTYAANAERWGGDQMHDAIFNQLLYGWGVVRTTWQRFEWDDEDSGFQGDRPLYAFPIDVRSLLPREVYPIPGGVYERWKAVIHRTWMKVYEVEEQFECTLTMNDEDLAADEELSLTTPLEPDREVEVLDYWCWYGKSIYHAVVAHNQFVMRPAKMKFYDCLPFTIFFCGKTTSKAGEYFGLSANYALIDSVAELEWVANRHMRIVDLYAEPTIVITRVNDESVGPVEPGGTIELVAGEEAHYLQFEGAIPDVRFLEQFFREQIEQEGFATYQAGASGLDTIAQQQQSLIKIFKPVENAQQAWEAINNKIIGLLQRYSWDKPVQVAGRMAGEEADTAFKFNIRGRETKGARETRVKLRARFPLEELRNVGAAATLKNSYLMSSKMIMRRLLGIQSPELERENILEERIEDMPELAGTLVQQQLQMLMKRSSIMDIVQSEVDQLAGRSQPSQQGTPEAPAPLDQQSAQSMIQGSPDMQIGQADAAMSTGNIPDNAMPIAQENPVGNLRMGGQPAQ